MATRAPRALKAAEAASIPAYMGMAKACLAWLAWLEGRFRDVESLAEEAAALGRMNNYGYWFLWLSLFPLMAARLAKGRVSEAVDASRALLAPPQLRLPDGLESTLKAAGSAWDTGTAGWPGQTERGPPSRGGVAISVTIRGRPQPLRTVSTKGA